MLRRVPRVVRIQPRDPEPSIVAEAAAVLASGELVAFPTETVYGLGARGLHADEVRRIFAAKGRPHGHPLILHVDGEAMARSLARDWTDAAARLAAAFWPGPLTLVVPKGASVPAEVTGGLDSVGLRCPDHPVAQALIGAVGEPLAAPSANAHMHVSPTSAAHVVRSLGDRVALVLDGGPCSTGIESTVVDLVGSPPRVLRPGALSLDRLREVLPDIVFEATVVEGDGPRTSPGQAAKHYAPSAPLTLTPSGEATFETVRSAVHDGQRVAAIVWSPGIGDRLRQTIDAAEGPAMVLVLPDDAEAYARELFHALHTVDEARCDRVVVERVPETEAFWAVSDRLARAART